MVTITTQKKKIKCVNPEIYKKQLKKLYVTLNPKERKKILDNLEEFCRNNNLKFSFEDAHSRKDFKFC